MNQEERLIENLKQIPTDQLLVWYSISRYHEKYKFAQFALEELNVRGYANSDVQGFDNSCSAFYEHLINTTTL